MKLYVDVFCECYRAIRAGVPIVRESSTDKEFHFQNWFEDRLKALTDRYERRGRHSYPDFVLVDEPEGYEIKGLAYPGREASYDANSQVPKGRHNGRDVHYVFGRYPKGGGGQYEVLDLVICHGSFLNADQEYVHKNRHVRAFGSYGDIMIRDRKMYVAPTPLALTSGTQGHATLILPSSTPVDDRLVATGQLVRREAAELLVGYTFDLRTNQIVPLTIPNPNGGREHRFVAYRTQDDNARVVNLKDVGLVVSELEAAESDDEAGN